MGIAGSPRRGRSTDILLDEFLSAIPSASHSVWTEQRFSPIFDEEGTLVGLDGIARDVTEQKMMEARVRYMGLHDPLTSLYNRAYFEEEMKRLDDTWAESDRPVTIVSTDVDGLKLVNDTRGHKEGDDLLKAYAEVLRETFKSKGIFDLVKL